MDFLNDLSNYYPYIVAWKLCKKVYLKDCNIWIDNFDNGEITYAWQEIVHHHKVKVVPKGDQCNALIAGADIVTRFFLDQIKEQKLGLRDDDIQKIANDFNINVAVHYIGNPDLNMIKPAKRIPIALNNFYKRPMCFIIKEDIIEKESSYIQRSEKMDMLFNFTSSINGGLKFIDYKTDYKNIRDGDFLVYIGEIGKNRAK